MSVSAMTGRMQRRRYSHGGMGTAKPLDPPCNDLWAGGTGCTGGTYGSVNAVTPPPIGYVLNVNTGVQYPDGPTTRIQLPVGLYLNSDGVYFNVDGGNGRTRYGMPGGGTAAWPYPNTTLPVPAAPAAATPAATADDGLIFGFEPTTLLWIGGGSLAALLALAYMPSGGKR